MLEAALSMVGLLFFSFLSLRFYSAYKRQLRKERMGFEPSNIGKEAKSKADALLDKLTIKDLTKTLIPSRKQPLLEFIVIGDGKNLHQVMPYHKEAKYLSEKTGKEYEVNEDTLFLHKPFWKRGKLMAIFNSEGEPYKVPDPEETKDKPTAETLYIADKSTALTRTLKEMFTQHLNLKKILFFVIIGIVGVVVFMVLSGGIRF